MQYCFGRGHLGLCGVVVELQLSSYAMGWCVGFAVVFGWFRGVFGWFVRGFVGLQIDYCLWGGLP